MVQVVILQVVRSRIRSDERVPLVEPDEHDERVRLRGFVTRHAGEHMSAHLEGGLAVHGRFLDVRERKSEFSHGGKMHRVKWLENSCLMLRGSEGIPFASSSSGSILRGAKGV